MWLGDQIDMMIFNGIEVQALKAVVDTRDFYSTARQESFNRYYVGIRISGDDYHSSWAGCDQSNSFLLEVTEPEYQAAAENYGAPPRQAPCVITYFDTKEEAQRFVEDYVEPKLMGTKLKYMDKKVINRDTYPQWQGNKVD